MALFRRMLIIPVAVLWILSLLGASSLATDFYPLHFAARLILSGTLPYGSEATAQLAKVWQAPFAQAGVAYPLPFILLVTPLALLPFPVAALIWTSTGAILASMSIRLGPSRRSLLLLPLLFLPLHRAVVMGQATLVWFGLAILMILAIRTKRPWVVGACIALLMFKPQNGLVFALAGIWWSWREDRRALYVAAAVGGSLGILAFVLYPGWMSAWRGQLETYSTIVRPPTLLPWGLILVITCWKLGWWARIAALQVILFPLSDLYSTLPLLLLWVMIGGPLALFGAGVSWLWQLLFLPNSMSVLWMLVLLPLMVAGAWRSHGNWHPRQLLITRYFPKQQS